MKALEIQRKILIPKRRTQKRTLSKKRSNSYISLSRPATKRRGFPPLTCYLAISTEP